MAQDIVISVKNEIVERVGQQVPTPAAPSFRERFVAGAARLTDGITGQFVVRASSKLINATGNTEISSAISKVARYGFLVGRALMPPTPIGVAALSLSVVSDLADKYFDDLRKRAAAENDVDNARIKAGLLDVSDARIRTRFFNGRQRYDRG